MSLRYRISLPGPFYCSGRVGPRHWLPRGSHTGDGPIGFMVKWFIIYPGVVFLEDVRFRSGPAGAPGYGG